MLRTPSHTQQSIRIETLMQPAERLVLRLLLACALTILSACVSLPNSGTVTVTQADGVQVQAAVALFDAYWEDVARRYSEGATYRGDHRYGDRFTDGTAVDAGQRIPVSVPDVVRQPIAGEPRAHSGTG